MTNGQSLKAQISEAINKKYICRNQVNQTNIKQKLSRFAINHSKYKS